jgi:hypothetical protein
VGTVGVGLGSVMAGVLKAAAIVAAAAVAVASSTAGAADCPPQAVTSRSALVRISAMAVRFTVL